MSKDDPEAKDPPRPEEGRRTVLGLLFGVGSAAYAGALVVPACAFLAGGGGGEEAQGRWARVAQLAKLKEGVPERVKVVGDLRDAFTIHKQQTLGSLWLIKTGDSVRALSAECPHLGCAVDVTGDGKSFACPCHTSRFGLEGKAESGPSPRGMDELAVRIAEGWVEVDFRRYRQGVPDKVEMG